MRAAIIQALIRHREVPDERWAVTFAGLRRVVFFVGMSAPSSSRRNCLTM
jgi:hypothetical protein